MESGFLKTEIGQAEENERWEVDNIIRTVTEDLIVDNLEFNDYIDDFAEWKKFSKCRLWAFIQISQGGNKVW